MEKMTYVVALNTAIDLVEAVRDGVAFDPTTDLTAVVEKLTALKEQTEKRNSKDRKPTPKEQAKANADDALAEAVLQVLTDAPAPMTVTEIKNADEAFVETKVQKLSAIVRKLLIDGKVKREEVKHKAVFSIA